MYTLSYITLTGNRSSIERTAAPKDSGYNPESDARWYKTS